VPELVFKNLIVNIILEIKSVQVFGRKKTAIAVAYAKAGSGTIKINGAPIELVEPQVLRYKVFEPILLVGRHRYSQIDIRVKVKGGGFVSQIYAIRQALSKAIVAYYQKYVDENEKNKIKEILMTYDRSLLAADPRHCEPKKVWRERCEGSLSEVLSLILCAE